MERPYLAWSIVLLCQLEWNRFRKEQRSQWKDTIMFQMLLLAFAGVLRSPVSLTQNVFILAIDYYKKNHPAVPYISGWMLVSEANHERAQNVCPEKYNVLKIYKTEKSEKIHNGIPT